MDNPLVYVVLNGELRMSAGKAAAQSVQAVTMLKGAVKFGKRVKRTVIVLEAKNTQQLLSLNKYLEKLGVDSNYYIDEGVNEVDPYSVTALAVGPIHVDDLNTRGVLGAFPLYPRKRGLFR